MQVQIAQHFTQPNSDADWHPLPDRRSGLSSAPCLARVSATALLSPAVELREDYRQLSRQHPEFYRSAIGTEGILSQRDE